MDTHNDALRANAGRKLEGWKSIARYLGRSERAVQLWELERDLPIRRIPGGPGQTVYAYAGELDAWMLGGSGRHEPDAAQAAPVPHPAALRQVADPVPPSDRPPGILVLPLENHEVGMPTCSGDALAQKLIARLAEAQHSVRVLSWQTAKCVRLGGETLESMAASRQVRYIVEGSVDCSGGVKRVDIRIVDADLDQIVLADRFVTRHEEVAVFQDKVARAFAMHFALVHEGALVEPICPVDTTPGTFLDYLAGVRAFFAGTAPTLDDALAAFERALTRDPGFLPARAMQGLALLQRAHAAGPQAGRDDRIRDIASVCGASAAARVTAAFLGAAIAVAWDRDWAVAEQLLEKALHRLPSSLASHRRLYERRSPCRPRPDTGRPGSPCQDVSNLTLLPRMPGVDVFGDLMALVARMNSRDGVRSAASPVAIGRVDERSTSARPAVDRPPRPRSSSLRTGVGMARK